MKRALKYTSALAACLMLTGCASDRSSGLINYFRNDYFEHTTTTEPTTPPPETTPQTTTTYGNESEPVEQLPELDIDNSGSKVTIYSFSSDIKTFLDGWEPSGADVEFKTGDISTYYDQIDSLLKAPKGRNDIDIFVVDQDHLSKYVDPRYALPLEQISYIDTSEMYDFNVSDCTYKNDGLYALNLNNNPGVFLYNREVAWDVLGTSDPYSVQEYISDWDSFMDTAERMKSGGYKMTPNFTDMYRAYGGVAKRFTDSDGNIVISDQALEWAKTAKTIYSGGMCGSGDIWTSEWSSCFTSGNYFGTFASNWLAEITLDRMGYKDTWGVCQGPNPFTWDNNYVLISKNSDNMEDSMAILRRLCVDGDLNYDLGMIIPDNSYVFTGNSMYTDIPSLDYQAPCYIYDDILKHVLTSIGANEQDMKLADIFVSSMSSYIKGSTTLENATSDFYQKASEL